LTRTIEEEIQYEGKLEAHRPYVSGIKLGHCAFDNSWLLVVVEVTTCPIGMYEEVSPRKADVCVCPKCLRVVKESLPKWPASVARINTS